MTELDQLDDIASKINAELHKNSYWFDLVNEARHHERDSVFNRLLAAIAVSIGKDEILEVFVQHESVLDEQGNDNHEGELQITAFTKHCICIAALQSPLTATNPVVSVIKRNSVTKLGLLTDRPAFAPNGYASHYLITLTSDALDEPINIGGIEDNRNQNYDSETYKNKMNHIISLLMEDLNS